MGGGRVEIQWEPKVAQMKCLWFCEKGKARWEWGVFGNVGDGCWQTHDI